MAIAASSRPPSRWDATGGAPARGARRRRAEAALIAGGLLAAGTGVAVAGWDRYGPPAQSAPLRFPGGQADRVVSPAVAAPRAQADPVAAVPTVPPPVTVDIPAIGIRTGLVALHVQPDGTLGVPADFATAGWWAQGPAPGAAGPAVIVGHVDSFRGPAVFFRLRDLRPGDAITVGRSDGTTVTFVVQTVAEYPKASYPVQAVYGPTGTPTLRLITCGGSFDRRSGHYVDNVVVYAAWKAESGPIRLAAPA